MQLHPVEAFDLLDALAQGPPDVFGVPGSLWRDPSRSLPVLLGEHGVRTDFHERWDWLRNPFPPSAESRDYCAPKRSPLCGNSIWQDRRFLARHMPTLEAHFHYRIVDVSTIKELAKRWRPALVDGFEKKNAHRALDDVHESIEELRRYRAGFFKV